jgi:hypothetical protein
VLSLAAVMYGTVGRQFGRQSGSWVKAMGVAAPVLMMPVVVESCIAVLLLDESDQHDASRNWPSLGTYDGSSRCERHKP